MEKVECGLISDITNFLKTISDIVFKAFDKLDRLGIETKDVKKNSDGSITGKLVSSTDESKVVEWRMEPKDTPNVYDLYCSIGKNSKSKKSNCGFRNVTESDLYEHLARAIEILYGESPEDWVEASSKLKVSLKRIVGEDESSIELCGINTSLPVKTATDILSNLMVEDFIETIPETETWYEVSETEDDYDIQTIDGGCEVDATTSVYNCLRAAFEALSTCQAVHWNARGEDFFTLHEKLDEYIEKLQGDIDELAEIIKQLGVVVPAPAQIYKECTPIDVNNEFDARAGFTAVNDILTVYCMTLDCYYVNVDHNVQSQFDEILSYWIKETQYKLTALLN